MATAMNPTYVNATKAIATELTNLTGIFAILFAITIWKLTDASMAHASHQTNVNAFMGLNRAQMPISHANSVNLIRTVTKWKPVQAGIIDVNGAVFTKKFLMYFLLSKSNG